MKCHLNPINLLLVVTDLHLFWMKDGRSSEDSHCWTTLHVGGVCVKSLLQGKQLPEESHLSPHMVMRTGFNCPQTLGVHIYVPVDMA